jgi:hypothetical protein
MTKQDIIAAVKTLGMPSGSYVVFGSCPMALAGIREAGDIDMLVSDELLERFKTEGWQQIDKGHNDKPFTHGVFEAHNNWEFSSYHPTLKQLLKTATTVNDVTFASLDDVRKWKLASGRPKDLVDVALIDAHLSKQR